MTVGNSELPFLVQRSEAIVAAVGGAIGPVAIAGTVVALLLVAAAGSYWVDRRRVEVALLAARGVGPLAIAAKAMLEMLLWLTLGGVVGWLAAIGLVRLLGPSDLLDPSATPGRWPAAAGVPAGRPWPTAWSPHCARWGMTERGIVARPGVRPRCPGSWRLAWPHSPPAAWGPRVTSGHRRRAAPALHAAARLPMLFLSGAGGLPYGCSAW